MQEDYREQSDFNMAVFTLGRLNWSLYLCSEHFRSQNLYSAFHEMMNLYMEVSTDMKGDLLDMVTKGGLKSKKKNTTDELKVMEKIIKELEPLVETYVGGGKHSNGINRELYTKLRNMNMLLRKIMKDAGLLMKMKDDARFAL